jgi:hypothetical protein
MIGSSSAGVWRRAGAAAGAGAAAEQLSRAEQLRANLPRGWSAEARYPTVVRMPARARSGFTADFGLGRHRSGVHGCSPDSSKFRPVLARPGPSRGLTTGFTLDGHAHPPGLPAHGPAVRPFRVPHGGGDLRFGPLT